MSPLASSHSFCRSRTGRVEAWLSRSSVHDLPSSIPFILLLHSLGFSARRRAACLKSSSIILRSLLVVNPLLWVLCWDPVALRQHAHSVISPSGLEEWPHSEVAISLRQYRWRLTDFFIPSFIAEEDVFCPRDPAKTAFASYWAPLWHEDWDRGVSLRGLGRAGCGCRVRFVLASPHPLRGVPGMGWICHRLTSLLLFLLGSCGKEWWCVWSSVRQRVAAGTSWSRYHRKPLLTRRQLPRRLNISTGDGCSASLASIVEFVFPKPLAFSEGSWTEKSTYYMTPLMYMTYKSSQSCIILCRDEYLGVALE